MVFLLSRVHYSYRLKNATTRSIVLFWFAADLPPPPVHGGHAGIKKKEYLNKEYRISVNRKAPDDVFLLLINPPSKNKPVQKLIAK